MIRPDHVQYICLVHGKIFFLRYQGGLLLKENTRVLLSVFTLVQTQIQIVSLSLYNGDGKCIVRMTHRVTNATFMGNT